MDLKKDRNQMLVYYLKNANKIFNEHRKIDQNRQLLSKIGNNNNNNSNLGNSNSSG